MRTFMIRLVVLAAFAAAGAMMGCGSKSDPPPAAAADVRASAASAAADDDQIVVEVTEAEREAFAAEAAAEITPENAEARANALLEEIMADE